MRPLQHTLLRARMPGAALERGRPRQALQKIKKAGGAEQYNANKKYAEAVAVAVGGVRGRHEGPDVLHLHAGPPLEDEGGPRARVCVPRDGGLRARVVLGGAGEDFDRGGRGEQFGQQGDDERFERWYTCSLCEQEYHGVVACALGWACWKTYVGRPETDCSALGDDGLGTVYSMQTPRGRVVRAEAELSMLRRLGGSEENILVAQNNLANTYEKLGRVEEALRMRQEVYSGRLKLNGEEHEMTLKEANNYASTLVSLERFEEAKSVLRKTMPVARRVLGESNDLTLKMRWNYAKALYKDPGATLDDLREAVTTLEDAGTDRAARARWRAPAHSRD